MATGADIPPELFSRILLDVCEDAWQLLDLRNTVPNRKDAIRNITACSLTCVYWAKICREKLFRSVWIKNYEDMCAFLSLVSKTPTKYRPISEYVWHATLVQRVGDRPWLHLIRMQPSSSQFWPSLHSNVRIYFLIENSPNDTPSSRRSISQRLFASLPRTPPSSCLQCKHPTIDKPHFVTPHDLTSLLQKFSRYKGLMLTNVAWSAQADFARNLLARTPLNMSSRSFSVGVHRSKYTAETSWLALTTMLRYSVDEHEVELRVLPSAQRVILDISRCLCQGHEAPSLTYYRHREATPDSGLIDISPQDSRAYRCWTMAIIAYDPVNGSRNSEVLLSFYGSRMTIPTTDLDDDNFLAVDHISVLCAHIYEHFTAGRSTDGMLNQSCPWAAVVGLCTAQPGFRRLQLEFDSHDGLIQFMEEQRAALGKLAGRITLFYYTKDRNLQVRAADFETLADLGDAYEHGYINLTTTSRQQLSTICAVQSQ